MAATIIDGIIILMLAGAISYGYYVSRKVQRLMSVLSELEPLVLEFSDAVDKSEESVDQMKQNLAATEAAADGPAQQPIVPAPNEITPEFSTRREAASKLPGMQVVRDKKELVRMFFEASRSESRV
jgi:hypothetical protein